MGQKSIRLSIMITTDIKGLSDYFVKYVEFFNFINQKQKASLYFEIIQNGILIIIGDWEKYLKFLSYYISIANCSNGDDIDTANLKKNIRNALIKEYKIGPAPYVLRCTSSGLTVEMLGKILSVVIGANTKDFKITPIEEDGKKIILLEIKTSEGLVNYFYHFHKRFAELERALSTFKNNISKN